MTANAFRRKMSAMEAWWWVVGGRWADHLWQHPDIHSRTIPPPTRAAAGPLAGSTAALPPSVDCLLALLVRLTQHLTLALGPTLPFPPAAEFFNEIHPGCTIRVVANTRKGHHDVTSKNPELDGQEAIVIAVPVYPS